MNKINSIIKNYRNGDFETRLTLFLNYRDLRKQFTEIDESELKLNNNSFRHNESKS